MPALTGKTVVITRARHQAWELAELFEKEGARVLFFPTIRIVPPQNPAPLAEAGRKAVAGAYDWIIFTSRNAVLPFVQQLEAAGVTPPDLPAATRVCAVGPATAKLLGESGVRVDVVPDEYVGEGVVEALAGEELAGARVLLPRAAEARSVVPDALRARGARVDVVEAYRNVPDLAGGDEVVRLLELGEVDILTFTSSSTVRNFCDLLDAEVLEGAAVVAAIGPVTAETARACGLPVAIVADEHTLEGLVRGCVEWAAGGR